MRIPYSWPWVEAQVAQTIAVWNGSATASVLHGPRYCAKEQQTREKAYDQALREVERELRRVPGTRAERLGTQDRLVASFARFSATALGLQGEMVQLITHDFLPAGTRLARWARKFDASLSMADITQACRNAWTACGLQALLGERVVLTPSILGYSLLYPYSDNFLDREDVSAAEKLRFSERFRDRLRRQTICAESCREDAVWALVALIEAEHPRALFPQVYDCLLAIHRAQQESIAQLRNVGHCSDAQLLRVSCAKGGSSVLADACLANPWLSEEESRFSFEWGVLLQLGDDLQDVREDLQRGSVTLFSRAAALEIPLDSLVIQLLSFSEQVGSRMDRLPHGTEMLKDLLRTSWRSLIIGAVAESHEFFSPGFIDEVEDCSPFRFAFLRTRHEKLSRRPGLYAALFDAFLEAPEEEDGGLPVPEYQNPELAQAGFPAQSWK